MHLPAVVAHCDWGKDPKKRWMAVAIRQSDHWSICVPETVGDSSTLFGRLASRSLGVGGIFVGFDFPIGLPSAYARKTGFSDFRHALSNVGQEDWSDWFTVCSDPSEISVHRPFYPMRPGGTKQAHLLSALGFKQRESLLRLCERPTPDRGAACMLFWTLGGNQVGKGAITGWQEVLQPNAHKAAFWPFDGPLDDLLLNWSVVIAETYPGDVYGQLGFPEKSKWSKATVSGRVFVAGRQLEWLDQRRVSVTADLQSLICQGFSRHSRGEDQFDALVGLLGMIDVAEGRRLAGAPNLREVIDWEGWILGQTSGELGVATTG